MPTAMTIYPYLLDGACWVFDDVRTGLKEEAFVLGMTEMISKLVEFKLIPNADKGFSMTFAAEPFDHDVELAWLSSEEVAEEFNCTLNELPGDGNWYRGMVSGEEMVGWLCPALFCYFEEAPRKIYVKADDPRARRFVSAPDQRQSSE